MVNTARQLVSFPRWSRQGSSRVQDAPVADPALIRALDVGQAAYLYRGGVTYTQIKRLISGPAALPAAPASDTTHTGQDRRERSPLGAASGEPALPDVSPFLNEAFGPPSTAAARPRARRDSGDGAR
jgi:hypothetical protein